MKSYKIDLVGNKHLCKGKLEGGLWNPNMYNMALFVDISSRFCMVRLSCMAFLKASTFVIAVR